MWRLFSVESRQRSGEQLQCQLPAQGATNEIGPPSVGAHVQFAGATSEGFSAGAELGCEVPLLEWKVDTAARGTELVCGDLG